MLRVYERKQVFEEKKYPICDCSRSNQMPWTDQTTEIAPYERTYFWVTISYMEALLWPVSVPGRGWWWPTRTGCWSCPERCTEQSHTKKDTHHARGGYSSGDAVPTHGWFTKYTWICHKVITPVFLSLMKMIKSSVVWKSIECCSTLQWSNYINIGYQMANS